MTNWLIDKSAYARLHRAVEAEEWLNRINRGLVRVTTITLLEVGYSFTSEAVASKEFSEGLLSFLVLDTMTPAIENRACEVQRELLARGSHRAASIPDLLVAATAELLGRVVLHVDKDFELIAGVTGQPVERLRVVD